MLNFYFFLLVRQAATDSNSFSTIHADNKTSENIILCPNQSAEISVKGGIGGCPAAPGASGNIVTEDLVFLLEAMGLKTGIDFDRLIAARNVVATALPDVELYGFTPDAGLPLGPSLT